ncbi:uncharacterized protein LOC121272672 isoform X2 [Carcharodon carcharias]|nr:uncharacterized protein LOC121272672 isoform X2 [Carcharodon carcharias]
MWCLTDGCDHRMPRNMRSSISTLSSRVLLLILVEHVSGQESGVESRAHSATHSMSPVAALAMCLSAILFLLMLCVLFTPKVIAQRCRCRRKAEDCTSQTISPPTYEEAVFGGQVKPCPPSEIASVFPAESYVLQCGPQSVHSLTLQGTPFYQSHFGPSYQMDTILRGTVLIGEVQCKDREEPPTYLDIIPHGAAETLPLPPRSSNVAQAPFPAASPRSAVPLN